MNRLATREYDVRDAHMHVMNRRNLLRIDWALPILVVVLAVIGWLTLYSAGRSTEDTFYSRQIAFFFGGLVLTLTIVCIDYRFLIWMAPLMYIVVIAMLIAVEFYGVRGGGSERWLVVGPIRVQPSELAKLVLVYALTWYFTLLGDRIRRFHWFALSFVIAGIPMALIVMQPNLGTAACLGPLLVVMMFVAGCRWWHLGLIFLALFATVPWLWWQMYDFDPKLDQAGRAAHDAAAEFYELKYYQKMRIHTFFNPEADPVGSGWQTIQSMITVGSGGMSGKGYLKGTQTRLNYLPEHHTDFIFSLYAEERGFVGVMVILGLYLAFLLRGLQFARDCPDMHGTLLAAGVVTILSFHIFVNVAITVGLLPVTGIPLPFMSYGGSFYMTTMMCVGILLNVPMRRRMFVNE